MGTAEVDTKALNQTLTANIQQSNGVRQKSSVFFLISPMQVAYLHKRLGHVLHRGVLFLVSWLKGYNTQVAKAMTEPFTPIIPIR